MSENEKNPETVDEIETIPEEDGDLDQAANKIKKLRSDLEKCNQERKEYLDGWQRARAELSNYKKDEAKRFEEFARFAGEGIMAEAVAVLDSFDLALGQAVPKEVERGIVLIRSQLEDILRRRGLEVMRPLGRNFDPAFHESLGEIETEGQENTVVEVLQPGYILNGKVLRPARVKISKRRV